MSEQFAPAVSQRRHWYAYEIGCVPDQLPGLAVSVCPCCGVPEMVGGAVFRGGRVGFAANAPPELAAITSRRRTTAATPQTPGFGPPGHPAEPDLSCRMGPRPQRA